MTQNKDVKIRLMFWLLSFTVLIVAPVSAQHGAPNGDWPGSRDLLCSAPPTTGRPKTVAE